MKPNIETWMVDYEHGDDEPQHAVLSWLDNEAKDLPEVGTQLVRKSDYDALVAEHYPKKETKRVGSIIPLPSGGVTILHDEDYAAERKATDKSSQGPARFHILNNNSEVFEVETNDGKYFRFSTLDSLNRISEYTLSFEELIDFILWAQTIREQNA